MSKSHNDKLICNWTGVETALARVDLLNSPNIASLYAFVLYLSCASRDDQDQNAPTLIGVAIRNAIRLKLHHHATGIGADLKGTIIVEIFKLENYSSSEVSYLYLSLIVFRNLHARKTVEFFNRIL